MPNDHTIFSNRANVHIYMENFELAIQDSDQAIALNASFGRAYLRKATAYFEMIETEEHLEKAFEVVQKGLALENQDVKVVGDLTTLADKIVAELNENKE